jgi:hypothetical protein
MHLATKIHIARFTDELEGELALGHHGGIGEQGFPKLKTTLSGRAHHRAGRRVSCIRNGEHLEDRCDGTGTEAAKVPRRRAYGGLEANRVSSDHITALFARDKFKY